MDTKPIPYHDLLRALTPGPDGPLPACSICLIVQDSVARNLEDTIFFSAVKPDIRKEIRDARGFCNEHSNQLGRIVGNGLGVALIHEDIVDTVIEELVKIDPPVSGALSRLSGRAGARVRAQRSAAKLAAFLVPQTTCLACRHQLLVEETYLGTLLRYIDDDVLASALRASPGLCLPHFRQALELVSDETTMHRLVEIEAECLRRLRDELRELARHFDHRFKHEVVGAVGDSWLRSIDQVAGKRGIR